MRSVLITVYNTPPTATPRASLLWVAMVLGNADPSYGQGAPAANAAQGSTSNLAVMGIADFVATEEVDQISELTQTVPELSEALEQGTVDIEMFKKVLEQLRVKEAPKMSQGVTQVRIFIETTSRPEKLKTLQAELGLAKAQKDAKDIEDLLKVGRKAAAPSRRELDFSIAVKKRDQTRDYLQKCYCANHPGDAMDPDSDEFKIQEMLLKDPADVDEDLWKVLQQRVDRRRNIGLQVRQTVGRTVSPNITTKQMETGVYAPVDLGEWME